jgi:hypothetical protein
MVLPTMITVPAAHTAFDETGVLTDAKKRQAAQSLGADLAKIIQRHLSDS